jgi:hypothetical protein
MAVPATNHASDDPATLHVAAAALTRHLQDWGVPFHPNQELLVTNAAKAVMDAVDDFVGAGGGTDVAEETEPVEESPAPAKSKK